MTKEKMVTDLKKIASQINEYADQLVTDNADKLQEFSIWIRLNVKGDEISNYEVSTEYGV